MASQEAHDWWADVQQDRDTLEPVGRRPVAVWADDVDFDLAPDRVRARRAAGSRTDTGATTGTDTGAARRRAPRPVDVDAADPTPGYRFVRAGDPLPLDPEAPTDELVAAPRRIVLETAEGPEVLVPARAERPRPEISDVAPPRGAGGVIQIKGRPDERGTVAAWDAPRRPARSAAERVAHRPDRIMLWLVALGFLLILLAFATGSSEAHAAI